MNVGMEGWFGWIVAVLAGGAIASLITWRLLERRHARELKRAVEAARRENAGTMERLRAAYTSVRLDQEHQRAALPRRLAAASLGQRAAIQRLEDELRFARAELDRYRAPAFGATEFAADDGAYEHGFAPTQPFDDRG